MRRMVLAAAAAALACAPLAAARAQQPQQQREVFDSGWRQVAADALTDLELSGAGVRVNNLVVTPEQGAAGKPIAQHVFSASALKRVAGKRGARVEIVGVDAEGKPTVVSVVAVNFYQEQPNATSNDTHRFLAFPAEVAATKGYWVRMVVVPQ